MGTPAVSGNAWLPDTGEIVRSGVRMGHIYPFMGKSYVCLPCYFLACTNVFLIADFGRASQLRLVYAET